MLKHFINFLQLTALHWHEGEHTILGNFQNGRIYKCCEYWNRNMGRKYIHTHLNCYLVFSVHTLQSRRWPNNIRNHVRESCQKCSKLAHLDEQIENEHIITITNSTFVYTLGTLKLPSSFKAISTKLSQNLVHIGKKLQ